MLTSYQRIASGETRLTTVRSGSVIIAGLIAIFSGAASACTPPLTEAQVMHSFKNGRLDQIEILSALNPSLVLASGVDLTPVSMDAASGKGVVLSFCVPQDDLDQPARLRVGENMPSIPHVLAASSSGHMALVTDQSAPNHAVATDVRRGRPDDADGVVVAFTLHNAGAVRGTLSSRVELSWEIPSRPCSDPDPRSIEIDLEIGLERQRAVWQEGRAIFEDDISAESSLRVGHSGVYDRCIGYFDLAISPPSLEVPSDDDIERVHLIFRLPSNVQETMGGSLELARWELTFVNEDVWPKTLSGE